jgi:hypothetical protein
VLEVGRKDAGKMKVLLLVFSVLFSFSSWANNFDTIETVCGVAERDAQLAISTLESSPNLTNQSIDERIRSVHALMLTNERNRISKSIEDKKRSGEYRKDLDEHLANLTTKNASSNYRFALCERKRRPGASKTTIGADAYSRCRDILLQKKPENYGLCF